MLLNRFRQALLNTTPVGIIIYTPIEYTISLFPLEATVKVNTFQELIGNKNMFVLIQLNNSWRTWYNCQLVLPKRNWINIRLKCFVRIYKSNGL